MESTKTDLNGKLGSIRYYEFNDPRYTFATTVAMIKDYYGQIPNYTIALCRYRMNGPETCALVQKTVPDHGSFICMGYSLGFAKGRLEGGVWTVENL